MEGDGEVDVPLKIDGVVAAGASGLSGGPPLLSTRYAPVGRFLGPAPRFASAGHTAGYLRVAVVIPPPADHPAAEFQGEEVDKQILVLYRYTHFSAVPDGVQVSGSTKLHYLRFAVPAAGDVVSSLGWVGSSLAPLIYHCRHSEELQALWSTLVSSVGVPPQATRLKLIADVGILRLQDNSPDRMDDVATALQGMIAAPWPGYHVAMNLRLPELVHVHYADEGEAADGEVVVGENCAICYELLESDVAMWLGCYLPHVFHGECLNKALKRSEMCPMCRRRLSAPDDDEQV